MTFAKETKGNDAVQYNTIQMTAQEKAQALDLLARVEIRIWDMEAELSARDEWQTYCHAAATVNNLHNDIQHARDEFDIRRVTFSEVADILRMIADRKAEVNDYQFATYFSNYNVGVEEFLWKVRGTMPTNWELCRECEHGTPTDEVCFDCE
jgi:hypothetical protein